MLNQKQEAAVLKQADQRALSLSSRFEDPKRAGWLLVSLAESVVSRPSMMVFKNGKRVGCHETGRSVSRGVNIYLAQVAEFARLYGKGEPALEVLSLLDQEHGPDCRRYDLFGLYASLNKYQVDFDKLPPIRALGNIVRRKFGSNGYRPRSKHHI